MQPSFSNVDARGNANGGFNSVKQYQLYRKKIQRDSMGKLNNFRPRDRLSKHPFEQKNWLGMSRRKRKQVSEDEDQDSQNTPEIEEEKPKQQPPKQKQKVQSTILVQGKNGEGSYMIQRLQGQIQIAKIFIERGPGVSIAQQHCPFKISSPLYYILLASIFNKVARRIKYEIQKLQEEWSTIVSFQMTHQILRQFAACRNWMSPQELDSFFKVIKVIYKLQKLSLFADQTIRLNYRLIGRQTTDKPQEPKEPTNHNPDDMDKGIKEVVRAKWVPIRKPKIHTRKSMNEVGSFFLTFKSIQPIPSLLSSRYPRLNWQMSDVKQALRLQIVRSVAKVARESRKFQKMYQNFPSLNITDEDIEYMPVQGMNLELQLEMVGLNTQHGPSRRNQIQEYVRGINSYIANRGEGGVKTQGVKVQDKVEEVKKKDKTMKVDKSFIDMLKDQRKSTKSQQPTIIELD